MPSYKIRLAAEIDIAADLDAQAADIQRVKALVDAAKCQSLTTDALAALVGAGNISIDAKMLGRAAKRVSTGA